MAEQDGIFKIKGTLGGVTFYKSQDGYLVREKGGIDRKRMSTDPAFQRTRENAAEFTTSCKYGKYLRHAIRPILMQSADNRLSSRLVQNLLMILKTDTVNERGQRTPHEGDLSLLRGFDFNNRALLHSTLYAPFSSSFDRTSGTMNVSLPSLVPLEAIKAPVGTTHFEIVAAGALIDLDSGESTLVSRSTDKVLYSHNALQPISLQFQLPADSDLTHVQLLGIRFYQFVNGNAYLLNNGAYNALQLIDIEKA